MSQEPKPIMLSPNTCIVKYAEFDPEAIMQHLSAEELVQFQKYGKMTVMADMLSLHDPDSDTLVHLPVAALFRNNKATGKFLSMINRTMIKQEPLLIDRQTDVASGNTVEDAQNRLCIVTSLSPIAHIHQIEEMANDPELQIHSSIAVVEFKDLIDGILSYEDICDRELDILHEVLLEVIGKVEIKQLEMKDAEQAYRAVTDQPQIDY